LLDGAVATMALISANTPAEEIDRRMAKVGSYLLLCDDVKRADAVSFDDLVTKYAPTTDVEKTAWLLSTSGTTSQPKQVAHTLETLTRTTQVQLENDFVWGELYDPYRFAGLQVVLQAVLGGSSICFPELDDDLTAQIDFMQQNGVNALSATPTLWRKILMTGNSKSLKLKTITLGGEIADDRILKSVVSAFPEARVRHIYASTEAGTGFSVTDGKAGFPASYLDAEFRGVKLRIDDGILMIHNGMKMAGYVGEESGFADDAGWVNTGDQVKVENDRVVFMGRASGVINVGGNKAYPEHVENILRRVPDVEMVRVYGMNNPIVGQLVVADVSAADNADVATVKEALMQLATTELKKHERPVKYQFVEAIEHSANGKVQRR